MLHTRYWDTGVLEHKKGKQVEVWTQVSAQVTTRTAVHLAWAVQLYNWTADSQVRERSSITLALADAV